MSGRGGEELKLSKRDFARWFGERAWVMTPSLTPVPSVHACVQIGGKHGLYLRSAFAWPEGGWHRGHAP